MGRSAAEAGHGGQRKRQAKRPKMGDRCESVGNSRGGWRVSHEEKSWPAARGKAGTPDKQEARNHWIWGESMSGRSRVRPRERAIRAGSGEEEQK